MKAIIQEDMTGCAIAAASVLSGNTYQESKAVFEKLGMQVNNQLLWSSTAPMRMLCAELGIELDSKEHGFISFDALPDKALLAIKWKQYGETSFWHWVVFAREADGVFIFDSKKGLKHNKRQDFGRIKPKWFIPVIAV